jgi:methylated-DNA-[protein]-cysteine S-methyltransferase
MISYFKSPLGWIEIEKNANQLIALNFCEPPISNHTLTTDVTNEVVIQLNAYFSNKTIDCKISMAPIGTPFQQKIWKILLTIPKGKTLTYSEVAKYYGNKKSVRAVGAAIGKNPILILIPCHRVIGMDGSMVGYAGGIENKKQLLEHEGYPIQKTLNL